MKQIRMILAVFTVLGLASVPAFAGTSYVAYGGSANTPIKVAYESLGTSKTVTLVAGTTTDPITNSNVVGGYLLGQNLTNGNLFHIELGNGLTFPASESLYLCTNSSTSSKFSDSTTVGYGTPAAGNTMFNIQASANVGAQNIVYLSTVPCNTGASSLSVNVPAQAPTGYYTFKASIWTAGGIVIDDSSAVSLVSVVKQFNSVLSSADLLTIDYLGNPGNGTLFDTGGNIAASLNKVSVNFATVDVNANSGANFIQAINLTDSANWKGVTKVYTTTTPNDCRGSVVVANVTSPSGTVVLSPTANFAANTSLSSTNTTLCIQVDSSTVLDARTITGTYYYGTTGGIAPAGGSGTFQTWQVNAYQAFNPYMYAGADQTVDVFNRFYNNSTQTATVIVEVFPADGTASHSYVLGTIPPNEAGLYWGSDIATTAGIAAGTSYAARFTVTAPPSMVNGVSFFKRSGGERQMPLYKSANSTYLMQ